MKILRNLLTTVILIFLTFFSPAQTPSYSWAKSGGNTSFNDGNMQVVNTPAGFVAGGDFIGSAVFGQEEVISNGESDIVVARFDETGELLQIESIGSENEELFKFLNIDNEGNIIISMMFTGFITVNGTEYTSFGGQDIMLIKFNADFDIQWVKHFGTGLTDYVKGMDTDNNGNIILYGKFKNEIDFDEITLTSMGSTDLYIVKMDPEGNVIFAFSEGGTGYEDAESVNVGGNDIYIAAIFYGETIINGQVIQTENPTGLLLAKYNIEGTFQWVQVVNGTKLLPSVCLSANVNGDLYLAGNFQDKVTFGDETLTTGEFDQDIYVAKYNPDGEAQWAGQGHSSSSDMVINMDIDIGGNVYLTGFYVTSISFGNVIVNYSLC